MDKNKFKVTIPTFDYYSKLVACRTTCPVGTDSGAYVQAIGRGEYEEAYRIAREPNPFASICGRVCNAPCEAACRHKNIDTSVSIRALKRFVTERHGVEATRRVDTNIHHTLSLGNPRGYNTGEKIAIIGSGAAGLSVAHDLARLGYKVTVFEALSVMGGCFYLVPEYRLPRDLVRAEIEVIMQMGIEGITNTTVGKDVSFDELRKDYRAVVISIGAWVSRKLPIEGVDAEGVLPGIGFLRKASFGEDTGIAGKKVIVIGGGNVAMDVARVAVRVGAKTVYVICLESMEEMPAEDIEVDEALEEGVIFKNSNGPRKVVIKDGKVAGLECVKVLSVFDSEKRFNPKFQENSEWILECDTIITSVGQASDSAFLPSSHGFQVSRFGTVVVEPETMWTKVDGVYAAGDAAYGPGIFIKAIASGQLAARSIHEYLSGEKIKETTKARMRAVQDFSMPFGYDRISRVNPGCMDMSERVKNHEAVELGYSEEEAKGQAARCLNCHVNTIFEGNKCVMCGGCVDICPQYCLRIVPLDQIELDENLKALIDVYYGISLENLTPEERAQLFSKGSAMIKDEDRCMRCGLCARRCPTKAITMEKLEVERIMEVVKNDD